MRTITVHLHPNAKVTKVVKAETLIATELYDVFIPDQPVDGKANVALIKVLSKYFELPKSSVVILKGEKTRHKVVGLFDK